MFGLSGFFQKDRQTTSETTRQDPYDPAAPGRIGDIANRQMDMAEEAWDLYQTDFLPYEKEIMAANRELLPAQQKATRLGLEETSRDIEMNRPVKEALIKQQLADIGLSGPAAEKFYKEAVEGVDPETRMGEATADVQQGFGQAWGEIKREMSRAGIHPGSAKYKEMMADMIYNKAKNIAGARTTARRGAQDESFGRLTTAMGVRGKPEGIGAPNTTQYAYGATPGATDPSGKAAGFMGGAATSTGIGLGTGMTATEGVDKKTSWGLSGKAGM